MELLRNLHWAIIWSLSVNVPEQFTIPQFPRHTIMLLFLTPIAHPVNVLMMGPGGYTFSDFFRVGLGLMIVCFVTLLVVMPRFWSL